MKYTAESPNLKAVHGDMTGKQRVRRTGRVALTYVNWLCSTGGSAQCTVMTERRGGGSRAWEEGAISIHGADSLRCTTETNTTLHINYTPIKRQNK